MLKAVFISSLCLLAVLSCLVAFRGTHDSRRESRGDRERHATPEYEPDGNGTNYMPSKDIVVIDGQTNLIPKSLRPRARALVDAIRGSEAELEAAGREVDVAKIELTEAMSEVESLQQSVKEAESEVLAAKQERDAQYATWRAGMQYDAQVAPTISAMTGQSYSGHTSPHPPLGADKAVRDAERGLANAKHRYDLQYSQAVRRIERARMRVLSCQNRIVSARAARERAKADLFDLREPPQ